MKTRGTIVVCILSSFVLYHFFLFLLFSASPYFSAPPPPPLRSGHPLVPHRSSTWPPPAPLILFLFRMLTGFRYTTLQGRHRQSVPSICVSCRRSPVLGADIPDFSCLTRYFVPVSFLWLSGSEWIKILNISPACAPKIRCLKLKTSASVESSL